jgi:hypothetical protein
MASRSILFFCHPIVRRELTYADVIASHLAGCSAFAQSDEDGVAKEAVLRPRQIGGLGGTLPPHPIHARESQLASEASLSRRRRGRAYLPSAQRLEATVKEGEGLLGHVGAEERAFVVQREPGRRRTRFRILIFVRSWWLGRCGDSRA